MIELFCGAVSWIGIGIVIIQIVPFGEVLSFEEGASIVVLWPFWLVVSIAKGSRITWKRIWK